jgi:precorrin-3B synthase
MLHPMQTGDGLLVRLHPRRGMLNVAQIRAIAHASSEYGNGMLDISGRGNLQVRGLTEATHPLLVTSLTEAGLTDGVRPMAPHQLTLVPPFAGFDPSDLIDARPLADAIEQDATGISGLPPKALITVDGGGRWPLDHVGADVRIAALSEAAMVIGIESSGGEWWFGPVAPEQIRAVSARLIETWMGLSAGRSLRLKDCPLQPLAEILPPTVSSRPQRLRPPQAGLFSLRSGEAVMMALPYGRSEARQWIMIADALEGTGVPSLTLTPWRGLAASALSRAQAADLALRAGEAGLIMNPRDPRLSISACPGSTGCARGTTDTYRDADRLASQSPAFFDGSRTVHVSGCAKGCAQPHRAEVTLVGDAGVYQVVVDGTARDKPLFRRSPVELGGLLPELMMKTKHP